MLTIFREGPWGVEWYLPLLGDIENIHRYAWGAAALAHLYQGLSTAVNPDATKFLSGSATLLMSWIYEYLPVTRREVKNQDFSAFPRACRWKFSRGNCGVRKSVSAFRGDFNLLQLSEVNWTPYEDMDRSIIPEYCHASDNICQTRTWLFNFNIKEIYVPERFARQFGHEQQELDDVPHWQRRTTNSWMDWRVEYAQEIEEFNRLFNIYHKEVNPPSSNQGAKEYSHINYMMMVKALKNDLPVIAKYLEGQELPIEVGRSLEKLNSLMSFPLLKSISRTKQVTKKQKMSKQEQFEVTEKQKIRKQEQIDSTKVLESPRCSDRKAATNVRRSSGTVESKKRKWRGTKSDRVKIESNRLRRSGRMCVQIKKFKHKDGQGADPSNPISL
ncbi:protein MAIN-LIKE 2-like isoform X3 [Ananas comosus]|uniref:Protein MAIN-LIKE 2-like isoform X3 n=1 Tax=Ananas comosus TaxID=4615 RepID=A0A6P5EPV1_ANACO|nr:protein MAIN-LIKE 2-like isoform X3 [Ananas comosus]